MALPRRLMRAAGVLGTTAIVLTVGAVPLIAHASDHLDAPALGSVSVDSGGNVSFATTGHEERDINDLYAFKGATAGQTALVLTIGPAVNAGLSPATFGSNVRYILNVDTNADSAQDQAYVFTFGAANSHRVQTYTVTKYTGANAASLATGTVIATGSTAGDGATNGQAPVTGGGQAYAGERADPFFFDLLGFLGSVKSEGTRKLNDGHQADFFKNLDTMGMVLQVPTTDFGATTIGVWAQTSWKNGATWTPADQVGRPAINTVFNAAGADKNLFNQTKPANQTAASAGKFPANVEATLKALSAGDTEGAYTTSEAQAIAAVLIPDILVYDTTKAVAGPLNGRAFADDVIDGELNIVTGGFPAGGRDSTGAITGDGVSAHTDYLAAFPYLAPALSPEIPAPTARPTAPTTSAVSVSTSGSESDIAPILAFLVALTGAASFLFVVRRKGGRTSQGD